MESISFKTFYRNIVCFSENIDRNIPTELWSDHKIGIQDDYDIVAF